MKFKVQHVSSPVELSCSVGRFTFENGQILDTEVFVGLDEIAKQFPRIFHVVEEPKPFVYAEPEVIKVDEETEIELIPMPVIDGIAGTIETFENVPEEPFGEPIVTFEETPTTEVTTEVTMEVTTEEVQEEVDAVAELVKTFEEIPEIEVQEEIQEEPKKRGRKPKGF